VGGRSGVEFGASKAGREVERGIGEEVQDSKEQRAIKAEEGGGEERKFWVAHTGAWEEKLQKTSSIRGDRERRMGPS